MLMIYLLPFFLLLLPPSSSLTTDELAAFQPRLPSHTDPNTNQQAVVTATDNGDGSQTLYWNGVPSHATWDFPNPERGNPNAIQAVEFTLKIDSTPRMRDTPLRCLPTGPIGIATSGTVLYSWFPAEEGCIDVAEFEELDICAGHPSPDGQYHYHYYSPCVSVPVCGQPSGIWGVALDGIPIYGPWDETGRQLTRQDLDECGGREDADGRYKYHITADPNYSITCLRGEIRSDHGREAQAYSCTCPYDDQRFKRDKGTGDGPPNGGPPDGGPPDGEPPDGGPPDGADDAICTFGTGSEPIACKDAEFLASLEYDIGYNWVGQDREIDLLPCCPEGADCGDSCMDDNGVKGVCTVEKRSIQYLTRMEKEGTAGESAAGMVAASVLVQLLLVALVMV